MRNTGITYSSTEKTPVVLPEFSELLPPLSGEQLAALETDILANGCYGPIIVDENLTVIDGHNRLKICMEHDIPYTMLVFSFADALEAKRWALDTQKGRRNLTAWELGQIGLKLRPDIEARAQANLVAGGENRWKAQSDEPSTIVSKAISPVSTRKELADSVGIGEVTMGKIMKINEEAPPVVKEALDKKELSINQGYNLTRQLQQLPEDQREDAAQEALEELRKEVRRKDAEIDRKTKIAKRFCAVYEKVNLLEVSEDNIRIWVDCTRMKPDEIADAAEESFRHSETFREIGDILKHTVLPEDWRNADEDSTESRG